MKFWLNEYIKIYEKTDDNLLTINESNVNIAEY